MFSPCFCTYFYSFVSMLTECMFYISLGSIVTPNIFGCVTIGSVVLSICRCSLVLYSSGFGVNCVEGQG